MIDVLNRIAQAAVDFFNPDAWRVALLVLVGWGVFLLIQIREVLRRIVLELQFISTFPEREHSKRFDEKSLE